MDRAETRACQNCRQSFAVEPEDFDFYKKIGVPPPTFCPRCRMQRRMTWRNERTLHRNTCAATGTSVISGFAPESGITVYDRDYWWSDAWDPLAFGREYDLTKPFFSQFQELLRAVPMPAVFNGKCVNTPYGNHIYECKNCYIVAATVYAEDVAYASICTKAKNCVDVLTLASGELCYDVVASEKLYNCRFVIDAEQCADSWLLYDCRGCTNCFGCVGLRNKSYHIWNEPYAKEEYEKKIAEMNPGSWARFTEYAKRFSEMKKRAIRKYMHSTNAIDVTGDHISHASNCKYAFYVTTDVRDCKFVANTHMATNDSYDGYGLGWHTELLYEDVDVGLDSSRLMFGIILWGGHDVQYSYNCHGCADCFGCIGLRNKSHCILNRQYTKEAYEKLLPQIIAQMNGVPYTDKRGREYRYGEFFPSELSPFPYNETIAQDHFPLTHEAADAQGFPWRDIPPAPNAPTIAAKDLPDDIRDVSDAILQEIISCEACGRVYRLIPMELALLQRMGIPLPRRCTECRFKRRFADVNPPALYHRRCMCLSAEALAKADARRNIASHAHGSAPCPTEFETSYAPDRPEIVYCEQCYQQEVA